MTAHAWWQRGVVSHVYSRSFADGGSAFGPIFLLDDVKRFFADRPAALRASAEPDEIPGGFLTTFQDPSGNTIYVMDQSTEAG